MANASEYLVPRELITRYATPGPRYTSYPTAPVWQEPFSAEDAWQIYHENNHSRKTPIALYVHLPFCTRLCWYCGCNVKISRNQSVSEPYLKALAEEIRLVGSVLAPERPITQMHWGGGTPTYLSPEQIMAWVSKLRQYLSFSPDAELSIEVDPRVTRRDHLEALRACGFNRLSMGVQDFNPEVQAAVNRIQSFEMTAELIEASRRLGFESINIDLMYGLPHQTQNSFATTLLQLKQLNPDRLALFNYAHVPWLKPAQKLIPEAALPDADTKLDIFEMAIAELLAQGYQYIGMDHFAKPDDSLAIAQRDRSLRRNFMGYTTQAGIDLYGLGVSSISEIDGHFLQNQREVEAYEQVMSEQRLPVLRGMRLSPDDHLRKAVIEQLICNGYLSFNEMAQRFQLDFKTYFTAEIQASEALAADELITLTHEAIQVLPRGQILIRNICMIWDRYLTQERAKGGFSKTI